MHCNVWCDKNLCDRRLTRIIRINKTCAEKCHFTVYVFIQVKVQLVGILYALPWISTRGSSWQFMSGPSSVVLWRKEIREDSNKLVPSVSIVRESKFKLFVHADQLTNVYVHVCTHCGSTFCLVYTVWCAWRGTGMICPIHVGLGLVLEDKPSGL